MRRMRRFFSSEPLPKTAGESLVLNEAETHHLRDILRLKPGDHCLVSDGLGREAETLIQELGPKTNARLMVQKISRGALEEGRLRLYVYLALPQKGKMDVLVEKAQELGVFELCPLETQRTLIKMSGANKSKALQRWQKIAQEALKQSGTRRLLTVLRPRTLKAALEGMPQVDACAVFHPAEDALPFRGWMQGLENIKKEKGLGVALFFGPEGGFTEEEVQFVCARCAQKIRLGETILKVDTAFLAVVSALRLLFA